MSARKHYRKNYEERLANPDRRKRQDARVIIGIMRRWGWIKAKPCAECGSTAKIEAHHPSYDRPLKVVWLCRRHHLAEHHPHLKVVSEASGSVLR